jgi:hypothetical protein
LRTIFNISFAFIILLSLTGCERNVPSDVVGNGLPPAVPVNVRVYSAYDGEIQLVWHANAEVDLKGYKIYRSTDSTNFIYIDYTDQNYYLDDSLNYSTEYFYRITAVDIENRESEPSSVVSAVPKNIYEPYAPRFPAINARNWIGDISVYLTWDPGYETDIAGFYIYRSTVAGFIPDSSTQVGFTPNSSYSDTLNLSLLTTYYYKIVAVDKGNLRSNPSSEVSDLILPMADIVYPVGNVRTNVLTFKFIAVPVPATYEISLQTNPYFGEIWSKEISSNTVNDTISVNFDGNYVNYDVNYYWRVSAYTASGSDPNSISPLYNFLIQQE